MMNQKQKGKHFKMEDRRDEPDIKQTVIVDQN